MLSPAEQAYIGHISRRLSLTKHALDELNVPALGVDPELWFHTLSTRKAIAGNTSNDLAFVSCLLAKAYLAEHHHIIPFDVAAKPMGAPCPAMGYDPQRFCQTSRPCRRPQIFLRDGQRRLRCAAEAQACRHNRRRRSSSSAIRSNRVSAAIRLCAAVSNAYRPDAIRLGRGVELTTSHARTARSFAVGRCVRGGPLNFRRVSDCGPRIGTAVESLRCAG